MTRNGVIIDRDFIDGAGEDIVPFIPKEWVQSENNYKDRVYSLANSYDTRIKGIKSIETPELENHPPFDFAKILKVFAEKNEYNHDAEKMVKKLKELMPYCPLNFVFALESTGDIGYMALVKFPIRKYNVV